MTEKLQKLISLAITDGVVTEKEREILFKNALEAGADIDEFEMALEAKLFERQQELNEKTSSQIIPPSIVEKPKSNKEGVLKKCPSCGTPVSSFQIKCTECGHEFRETHGNNLIKELEDKISRVQKKENEMSYEYDDKVASIIQNFPIPNNKEDLFEVLSYMSSKFLSTTVDTLGGSKLRDSYYARTLEILTKLKFMPNLDSNILISIQEIESKMKKKKKGNLGKNIILIVIIGLSFYFLIKYMEWLKNFFFN